MVLAESHCPAVIGALNDVEVSHWISYFDDLRKNNWPSEWWNMSYNAMLFLFYMFLIVFLCVEIWRYKLDASVTHTVLATWINVNSNCYYFYLFLSFKEFFGNNKNNNCTIIL